MKGILTIDIGTTSIRAILFDERANPGTVDKRMNAPHYYDDGRVEQDTATWLTLLYQLLNHANEEAKRRKLDISCIALTSPRSSVIPVDVNGTALYSAIMWQDTRTFELVKELSSYSEFVRSKTGSGISSIMAAIKMLWFKRKRPDIFNQTHKMLTIHDFILFALTGRFVTDHSVASRSNLFNLSSCSWDSELADIFQIKVGMLSELVPPGSIVGGLKESIAQQVGLLSGIPVVSAGGDQQCAALGLGLLSENQAISNTGTGSYVIGHSQKKWIDPLGRVTCSVSALAGAYIIESVLPTSGIAYQWCKEMFENSTGGKEGYSHINSLAKASGIGARGVSFLPHFAGSGTPYWDCNARGHFAGISAGTTRGDFARAILEGIAFDLADCLNIIEDACGTVACVHVGGGLALASIFNQIQADSYGRKVLFRDGGSEASTIGAFIAGAVAMGIATNHKTAWESFFSGIPELCFEPNSNNTAAYKVLRNKNRLLYVALAEARKKAEML